jgi:hypothetical protein
MQNMDIFKEVEAKESFKRQAEDHIKYFEVIIIDYKDQSKIRQLLGIPSCRSPVCVCVCVCVCVLVFARTQVECNTDYIKISELKVQMKLLGYTERKLLRLGTRERSLRFSQREGNRTWAGYC